MDEVDSFREPYNNGELVAGELRSPLAVRDRCGQLLARARAGRSDWFDLDPAAQDRLADAVCEALTGPRAILSRRLRPARIPPLPSCWRLLEAGGVDRRRQLDPLLAPLPPGERTHAWLDLATVLVLMQAMPDALGRNEAPGTADAPPPAKARSLAHLPGRWRYTEAATGQRLEGPAALAVATFHGFIAGLFSSRPDRPCQVDARGLRALVTEHLAQALQLSSANPLPGLAERAVGLRRLGERLASEPEVFGEEGRPGSLYDLLEIPYGLGLPHTADVAVADLLAQVLISLSGLGPETGRLDGCALGDSWRHPAVRGPGASDGWVPFHTLAQRLTLSLLEPFAWSGVQVGGLAALTAPADARHGRLMMARGLLRLRDPEVARQPWHLGDEPVVEWRALTLALQEELVPQVRQRLGLDADRLPVARLDLPLLLGSGLGPAERESGPALRLGFRPGGVSASARTSPCLQVAGPGPLL